MDEDQFDAGLATASDVELEPSLSSQADDHIEFRLLGRVVSESTEFEYEAGVRFELREPATEYSEDVAFDFGSKYAVPYLMPYVQLGLDVLYAQAGIARVKFPLVVFDGALFTLVSDDDDDGENENEDDD